MKWKNVMTTIVGLSQSIVHNIILRALILILMTGEVIFSHNEPDMPPDFIFGPANQNFIPDLEEIEVLF